MESGTKLGPYEIHEQLGAGGMGEVYRATDTRLDRTVAIKVLPEHLADDPTRRERFEREAKAVSSLNHPHICALYDVGDQDGTHYLVMEHVEGEIYRAKFRPTIRQRPQETGGICYKFWTNMRYRDSEGGFMRAKAALVTLATIFVCAIAVFGQQQPRDPVRTPGVQSRADPNRAAFVMANCGTPTPPPAAAGRGRGGGGQAAVQPTDYTVTPIPGVIAAGQRWQILWEDGGNNADSPIGVEDGVLIAQNDKSQVLKVGLNGQVTLLATDTYTGGALAMTTNGELFVGERALHQAIWMVEPERKLFTNTKDGEPFECFGQGVLNDMVADTRVECT